MTRLVAARFLPDPRTVQPAAEVALLRHELSVDEGHLARNAIAAASRRYARRLRVAYPELDAGAARPQLPPTAVDPAARRLLTVRCAPVVALLPRTDLAVAAQGRDVQALPGAVAEAMIAVAAFGERREAERDAR